jgi:hypothetical protein
MNKTKQVENNKTKLAEFLFSSDVPTELILWTLSNLPDTNGNGNNKVPAKVNHKSKTIYGAFNLSEKEWDEKSNKLNEILIKAFSGNYNSEIIESLRDEIGNDETLHTIMFARYVDLVKKSFLFECDIQAFLKSMNKKK